MSENRYINHDKLYNNILDVKDYRTVLNPQKHYTLNTTIVSYYGGRYWNIIPLDTMLQYPILYFKYWHNKHNKEYINSLLVCPITMRSMIFKGKISIVDIKNDSLQLYSHLTKDTFSIDDPYTPRNQSTEKQIKSHIKRHEVKITTLRKMFMYATDIEYTITTKKDDYIVNKDYYTNRIYYDGTQLYNAYHPKSIVYVIQYYSFKHKSYIYDILIGKNMDKVNVTGYDIKESGIWEYLSKHKEKLIARKPYIFPIMWFHVDKMYKNSNKILLR